ncbi:MAG: hypothetical protein CO149_06450 [Nitrospirae bacterium CG_4_9_14_3_um_filter_51_5]|nr:MAG: hypothetical protein CO149_06450 [Nitrospirae bacterium CG_4_9_14_3_um_filter_51_5]
MTTINVLACRVVLLGIVAGMCMGCVHQLTAHPAQENLKEPLVFCHIHVWQDKPSGRIFLPELASLEFITKDGERRYRVDIEAASSYFFLSLKPGQYQVTRVCIHEGWFRSSAEVPLVFEVPDQGVAYLGEWRFYIDSPNFTRELEVIISYEPLKAIVELRARYPSLPPHLVVSSLAEPFLLRSRLYEITPYPRFRWFQRHNPT